MMMMICQTLMMAIMSVKQNTESDYLIMGEMKYWILFVVGFMFATDENYTSDCTSVQTVSRTKLKQTILTR